MQTPETPSQSPGSSIAVGALDPVEEAEPACDLGEFPEVPVFMGRDRELATVKQWIVEDRHHLIGLFGLGGVGKRP